MEELVRHGSKGNNKRKEEKESYTKIKGKSK